ncbi:unnamed protein product, partial [Medioppia subpectinata]
MHLKCVNEGMDEVNYGCWQSNPDIAKFMKDQNMTKVNQVEEYYVRKTLTNVKDVGYNTMLWQDPVDNGVKLDKDSIVVIWKDTYLDSNLDLWQNYISKIAKNGYQMVLSACWYLNYISTPYPDKDWEKYYLCDPRHFNGTESEKDLVIGGEVCMWSEFVDGTNVLSRLWPRASSAAERLWSNSESTQDVDTARLRLDQHRCRMLRRGIPAAPILNGYCGDYEWEMNNQEKLMDLGDRGVQATTCPKGNVPEPGNPWPLPQQWVRSADVSTLDPKGFRFDTNMKSCDVLVNGMKRYRDIIFLDQRSVKSSQHPVLKSVFIDVQHINDCDFPKHEEDESYTLNITLNGSAKITSVTVWGALRALETFSQLVYQNEITKEISVNSTQITDFPRYKFRAMHLDTARHFVPKKVILANLDAMAYNKFNVFHWHIIDDQSFPFESIRYPELTKKGAYSPKHVYTQKDVSDIIEYSRMRGIRVIPEIDSPGHTHAMARAFPELLTPCYGQKDKPYTPHYPDYSASELLNPLKNFTFVFLKELFKEFKQ